MMDDHALTSPTIDDLNANELLNTELYEKSVYAFLRHFSIVPRSPDLDFLSDMLLHFANLPYENVSKIIKHHAHESYVDKIRLPGEVMEAHAEFRFGGTCFSLTFFLQTIVTHLGYICYPVMADMTWKPNSHCALVVLFEGGKYLVDPGYLLNRPMLMHPEKPRMHHTDVTGVELVCQSDANLYNLYTFNKQQMKWRYRFADVPCSPKDFLFYWIDSFGWHSMQGLCLTRVEKGRMVYMRKNYMQETTFTEKKKRYIETDYHETINQVFGIHPEKVEEALAALGVNMKREKIKRAVVSMQ